jgi:hypothetical protein
MPTDQGDLTPQTLDAALGRDPAAIPWDRRLAEWVPPLPIEPSRDAMLAMISRRSRVSRRPPGLPMRAPCKDNAGACWKIGPRAMLGNGLWKCRELGVRAIRGRRSQPHGKVNRFLASPPGRSG